MTLIAPSQCTAGRKGRRLCRIGRYIRIGVPVAERIWKPATLSIDWYRWCGNEPSHCIPPARILPPQTCCEQLVTPLHIYLRQQLILCQLPRQRNETGLWIIDATSGLVVT